MTKVLLGIADTNVASDLTSLLMEMDGYDVRAVAKTTADLLDLAGRLEPELVFVDEHLGVEPVAQTIRDLIARRPAMAILQVSPLRTDQDVIRAMEAGARGVVAYPFTYDDVSSRVMTATEWSIHMSGILEGAAASTAGRGRVVAVVGAKGGVGTTTIATHLAADHVERHPQDRVCLVDVDIEKGDVAAILEVRQAVSIADVAKVSGDLSVTAVNDAVVQHESGINLLLAPLDVREAEFVSAEALRAIVAMLRREFAVVIIDGGGHVSPAQAAVVEIADEALVVTTADVLAMRGLRRRMIAWDALGVREEAAFKVLVNQVDKASIFPTSSVARLTTAQVLDVEVPYSPRVVELAMNARQPRAITEVAWWRLIGRVGDALGTAPAAARVATRASGRGRSSADEKQGSASTPQRSRRFGRRAPAAAAQPEAAVTETATRLGPSAQVGSGQVESQYPAVESPDSIGSANNGDATNGDATNGDANNGDATDGGVPDAAQVGTGGTRGSRERGGIGLENAGIFPLALLMCLLAWQVAVIGFTFVYAGHATTHAAREYAVTGSQSQARAAAREAVPAVLRPGLQVGSSGNAISVTVRIPAAAPSQTGLPQSLTTTRDFVSER